MHKIEFTNICTGLMVICILFLTIPSQSVAVLETSESADTASAENVPEPEVTASVADKWEYVFENRPDPFLPFIEEKVATKTIPEDEEVILTGMQVFEPGQLKLVAIMFSSRNKIAMVEDVTGKGYILNEGMLIGRYGVVSQIAMDQVNITETRTVAGKEVVTPVVMRLNKEGDK